MSFSNEEYSLVGIIFPYGGNDIDKKTGWLMCDGSEYDITTNPELINLYNKIGTSWGSSGTNKFNVPDLRGMFLRGVDHGINRDVERSSRIAINTGGNTGDNVGSYQDDAMREHQHQHDFYGKGDGGASSNHIGIRESDIVGTFFTNDAGNGLVNETRDRNVAVNYIIKF